MKKRERWLLPLGLLAVACLAGPDFVSAKWLGVSALAIAGAWIALFLQPVLPDLEKKEWIGFGVLGAFLLGHLFWFHPAGYEFSLLGRISFFLLAWCAWRGFSSLLRWSDFWWPLACVVLLNSLYGFWLWHSKGVSLGGTGAGLVGASLALWWAIPAPKKSMAIAARVLAGGLGLAFVFYFDRYVGAALLPSVAFLGFSRGLKLKAKAFLVPAVTALLALGVFFAIPPPRPANLTFTERASLWKPAWSLAKAHPLGVGVDRFAFSFPAFQQEGGSDSQLLFSPQNEFLRWLTEDGFALSFLFLLAALYVLHRWRKKGAEGKEVALPFLLFLLPEMFWGAPWQNPFTFALGALMAGFLAAGIWKRRMLPAHAGTRATLLITWLFLLVCFGRALASRAFENVSSVKWAAVSCRAVPSNWRGCLNHARLLLAQGETTEARREVERVLEDEPGNYVALRYLGGIALRQGDRLEACFLTWKYDDLFHGKSELSDEYLKNCPAKWREYFTRKRPKKYYRR